MTRRILQSDAVPDLRLTFKRTSSFHFVLGTPNHHAVREPKQLHGEAQVEEN